MKQNRHSRTKFGNLLVVTGSEDPRAAREDDVKKVREDDEGVRVTGE